MGGLFLSVALRVLAARALRLPAPGRFAVRVNHTLAIRPAISTQSQRLRLFSLRWKLYEREKRKKPPVMSGKNDDILSIQR
jgi:hypothetical protein